MNPQDPLANLQPLREPLAIGWWPPAPGWWLAAVVALVALGMVAWILIRRYRASAYRRRALVQLSQLAADYQAHQDTQRLLADTNALIKSVALVAYPRREVAASSGEQWLSFLNSTLGPDEQFPAELVSGAYHRTSPSVDTHQLQHAASRWIRRHEVGK